MAFGDLLQQQDSVDATLTLSNVTAGSTLIAAIKASTSTAVGGVSDPENGAWTEEFVHTSTASDPPRLYIFRVNNASAHASLEVTRDGGQKWSLLEYEGETDVLEDTAEAEGSGTAINTGAASTPAGDWLAIAAFGLSINRSFTIDAPFTLDSSTISSAAASQVSSGSGTTEATGTLSGSTGWSGGIAVFPAVAADPTISSVTTIKNAESFTITGTDFSSSGNSVTLGGVTQTITAESTTEITCTNVRSTLKYGTNYNLVVTDSGSTASDPDVVQLNPQTGWNHVDLSGVIPLWAEAESITTGDQRVNAGNLYEAATTGTTGSTAPTHTSGTVSDGGVDWTWQQEYDRITATPDIVDGDQLAWGNVQGGAIGDVTVSADSTFTSVGSDPSLTNPTGASDGSTTATGTVDTAGASGTLSWIFSTVSTTPTAEEIVAGQSAGGAAAAYSNSQAVSASGEQSVTGSGLTTDTTYYPHYYHRTGVTEFDVEAHDQTEWGATATQTVVGDDGAVVSGAGFTTDAVVAAAGPDQTVAYGATVQLNGGNSTGNSLTYAWTQTSGTSVTLSDATIVNPTFTAPGADTTIVMQLEVTDDESTTDTDSVSIEVVAEIAAGIGRRQIGFKMGLGL